MFAARVSPEVFFSHSTAARVLGIPVPWRLERLTALHVTIAAPTRAPHAAGIIGHSRPVFDDDVVTAGEGLRVSSPARIFCEMASVLALGDLVAVADHIIHRRRPLASRSELAARISAGDRISRSRKLVAALELADDRAESAPESRLRVVCISAGFPRPLANHEVIDPLTGRTLRLDLAWPDLKIAIEYHGDYHRAPDQWRRDMTRKSHLEADGWIVVELNADDLRDSPAVVARIAAAFARRV